MNDQHTCDPKWSEGRLWDLIEQRTQSGADVARIDKRIWDLFGEEWAVVFTDLSGFSRRSAEFGILHFLQIIHESHKLLMPVVIEHDGILIKAEADSYILIFRRPERALECAIAMQQACQQLSKRRQPDEKILLCVGIGFGKILRIGDTDVFGEQVNVASKLGEDTARANEILISEEVHAAVGDRVTASYEPLEVKVSVAENNFRVLYEHKT